jgi:RNase P subunit RPR2
MKGLTPYQGRNHSAAGIFECHECGNEWFSAYTWANTPQGCLNCHTFVYPIHQWRLKRNKKSKNVKKHIQSLCGKCQFHEKSCAFK